MDPAVLKEAAMCFNVDSMVPADLITGGVAAERWDVEIVGKAAHAGVAPEKGISSTLVASIALAEAKRGGWFSTLLRAEVKRAGLHDLHAHVPAEKDATGARFEGLERWQDSMAQDEEGHRSVRRFGIHRHEPVPRPFEPLLAKLVTPRGDLVRDDEVVARQREWNDDQEAGRDRDRHGPAPSTRVER